MKRLHRPLVVLVVGMAALLPSPVAAQLDQAGGGTVVTVEGRIVEITVNIDVIVPEGFSDPSFESSIRDGFSAAAAIWNQAFRKSLANGCYSVELSMAIRFVDGNMAAGGGHDMYLHRIYQPRFSGPQLTTETTNDDTAEVFTTNGTLYLAPWVFTSPRNLAHELGHTFGLGDDYTRDAEGNPVYNGRDGTLMDGGDVIDQALIDRIGDLARRSGASLPECWEGTASVATSSVNPEASCQDGWELGFTFVVSAEGTIDGQGTADLTSTPTCNFPIDPIPWIDHHEYQVSGEETAGGFSLRFAGVRKSPAGGTEVGGLPSIYAEAGGQPVEVAVSGNSGTGQGMWQGSFGVATLTANGTVTVECVTCEEAVG